MKIVVKEDGKTVVEVKRRNELHFEIQRNTRSQQVLSKKEKVRNNRSVRKAKARKEIKNY